MAGIDYFDILLVVVRQRRRILAVTAVATAIAVIAVMFIPNSYTASARIMPPQQGQASITSLLGQLGPLANMGASQLGLKNPSDIYVGMLKSRSVADALVRRFDLKDKVYRKKTYEGARRELADNSEILAVKDGSITILVTDHEKARAKNLANGYIEELQNLTGRLALTEAGQRRAFYEQQLNGEKQQLASAEVALKNVQEQTGLIQLDAQGKALVESLAKLRAEVAMREVALHTARSFSADQNPDVIRLKEELAGLRQQLANMERTAGTESGSIQLSAGKVPEAALEYVRRLRDLKYHETLYEFLSKQLEAARIDEAKGSIVIQVLDSAIEPETKSGPKRLQIVLTAALMSLLGSAACVVLQDRLKRSGKAAEVRQMIRLLTSEARA